MRNNQLSLLPNDIFTPLPQATSIVLDGNPLACCPSSLAARQHPVCSGLPPCPDKVTA